MHTGEHHIKSGMTHGLPGPITALVVTYNRLNHLKKTLGALLENTEDLLARVIVVNNASTDGTAE